MHARAGGYASEEARDTGLWTVACWKGADSGRSGETGSRAADLSAADRRGRTEFALPPGFLQRSHFSRLDSHPWAEP